MAIVSLLLYFILLLAFADFDRQFYAIFTLFIVRTSNR